MARRRVLIVGCGDVGNRIGTLLRKNYQVYGLRRNVCDLAQSITPIQGDIRNTLAALPAVDELVFCPAGSPQYHHVYSEGLKNVLAALTSPISKLWITSSTGVYNQDAGECVDETAAPRPDNERRRALLGMESIASHSGYPYCIIRFSGLYSLFRSSLYHWLLRGNYPLSENHWNNRIHVADAARSVVHLMQMKHYHTLYIATGSEPFTASEMMHYLSDRLHLPHPTSTVGKKVSGKRLDNTRLRQTGFALKHDDIFASYGDIAESLQALGKLTPFQQRVLRATANIPYGRVASYADVARIAGCSGAARAAGQALGRNPLAPLIPCHRVVNSAGELHGFSRGGGNQELQEKYQRLIGEGVSIIASRNGGLNKAAVPEKYFWRGGTSSRVSKPAAP